MLVAIAALRSNSKLAAEVGVGVGATTGAGVAAGVGVFFKEDTNVALFKSNDPGTQNLQRSVVLSGTSTATHG